METTTLNVVFSFWPLAFTEYAHSIHESALANGQKPKAMKGLLPYPCKSINAANGIGYNTFHFKRINKTLFAVNDVSARANEKRIG